MLQDNVIKSVVALAADYRNRRLFFSDTSEKSIYVYSLSFNGKHLLPPYLVFDGL